MATALSERQVSHQRQTGAYYTPASAAEYMADWTLRTDGEALLEPSFGDGAFLRAIASVAQKRSLTQISLRGIELDPDTVASAVRAGVVDKSAAVCGDFLAQTPRPVDGVIGNPPYVRLRHLKSLTERQRALTAVASRIPQGMEPSGSLWMPFVVHAASHLSIGGRLALVLPYELTYVRYARPLWRFLGDNFGSLRVVRVFQRVFPDILQDVVLLFADGHGARTSRVTYETYDAVSDLIAENAATSAVLEVDRIVAGNRDFVAALLPEELQLLLGRIGSMTYEANELMKVNIGYVSGDKTFFHPDPATIANYRLPASALRSAVTTTRSLRGKGLRTSQLPNRDVLFQPTQERLTQGELRYVAEGIRRGVNQRYKCQIRNPWYIVPGVLVPTFVMSVFSSTPLLMINDAQCVASNSLLCGYVRDGVDAASVVAGWYTSLTLLECELRVHSLGGGVLVMIPGEASKVRVAKASSIHHLDAIDERLRAGDIRGAYSVGDEVVLAGDLGLTTAEVALIRRGAETLTRWREADRNATPLPPS